METWARRTDERHRMSTSAYAALEPPTDSQSSNEVGSRIVEPFWASTLDERSGCRSEHGAAEHNLTASRPAKLSSELKRQSSLLQATLTAPTSSRKRQKLLPVTPPQGPSRLETMSMPATSIGWLLPPPDAIADEPQAVAVAKSAAQSLPSHGPSPPLLSTKSDSVPTDDDIYCPGYRRGCVATRPLVLDDFAKKGKRLKCCQFCRTDNSAYQMGYNQKARAIKAELQESRIPSTSGKPDATTPSSVSAGTADLHLTSAPSPVSIPLPLPALKIEAAPGPPSLKIRLVRLKPKVESPSVDFAIPNGLSGSVTSNVTSSEAAMSETEPSDSAISEAGPSSTTTSDPEPSSAAMLPQACAGYRGKGPKDCCAPRPLKQTDFTLRNGSIKRACCFCREKNRLRRSSSQLDLQKKAIQQLQQQNGLETPPLLSLVTESNSRRVSLPDSGSPKPYVVRRGAYLHRPLLPPEGRVMRPAEAQMPFPELVETLKAQLAEVTLSTKQFLLVASSEAIPTSFHGETAVLNEVLEKLVEARGRVIDSLGVLLLRLAEQSPSIDAADEVKQRFICNTKQAVEAVESFETSPKAFSQAGHHVVEGFQFWRVRRMIGHDPTNLLAITSTIEECFPSPVANHAASLAGQAHLDCSPGTLILRAICFSLAKDAVVAELDLDGGAVCSRVRAYMKGGKFIPLATVTWEELKVDLEKWVAGLKVAVEGSHNFVTRIREAHAQGLIP